MTDYSAMYRELFCAQLDAIDEMKAIIENLIKAHQQIEELYMRVQEPEIDALETQKLSDQ